MFIRFFIFLTLLSVYSFSYSYEFSDTMFKYYVWNYDYKNSYVIDNLKFIAQAPLQTKENWWKNYESCEEASLLMSHFNINNIYFDKYTADKEIDSLNDYQEFSMWIERNKYHNKESWKLYLRDITIKEIQNVAKKYYWYTDVNSHVINNPSIETIKYLISNDFVLIVPSYTKTLANPNFNLLTNSYHVINLVWYDESNFIAFDPGTSKWENYRYPYKNVIDWIKQNWDDILVLEWKRNTGKIWFVSMIKEIELSKKVALMMSRINKVLDKNANRKEILLKNVLANIDKLAKKEKNSDKLRLYQALYVRLDEKLQVVLNEKSWISFLANKLINFYKK